MAIYCNKCGKEMDDVDIYGELKYVGMMPYGSKYDMEHVEMHLCIECLDELVDSCVISPIKIQTE